VKAEDVSPEGAESDAAVESETDSELDWQIMPGNDAAWYARDVKVRIDKLDWDTTARHGQIRLFDEEYGKRRMLEMLEKQPVGLLHVVLVCKDHSGMVAIILT
jgi:hypothetical protein